MIAETKTDAPAVRGSDSVSMLIVEVDGLTLGLMAEDVRDVLHPVTPDSFPGMAWPVLGCFCQRDEMLTMVDLGGIVGAPPPAPEKSPLVVLLDEDLWALRVNAYREFRTISLDQVEPLPPTVRGSLRRLASGVVQDTDRLIVLVDGEGLRDAIQAAANEGLPVAA